MKTASNPGCTRATNSYTNTARFPVAFASATRAPFTVFIPMLTGFTLQ